MNRFITFSIPTYNRGNKLFLLLSILLTEIKNSKYKDEIGVFISNNGSTDNTKEVIINFKKQFILKYLWLIQRSKREAEL